jgi:hypothetical protein
LVVLFSECQEHSTTFLGLLLFNRFLLRLV